MGVWGCLDEVAVPRYFFAIQWRTEENRMIPTAHFCRTKRRHFLRGAKSRACGRRMVTTIQD
jgi:hypothetical protein